MKASAVSLLLLFLLLSTSRESRAITCEVNGTLTAESSTDPGFEGLFKYTLDINWDVGEAGLSNMNIFLALETCECVCDEGIVQFGSPAGTSNGETPGKGGGDPCTVEFLGEYLCTGNPEVPPEFGFVPAVKFEVDDASNCEPLNVGSGVWCFYSPLSPAPFSSHIVGAAAEGDICLVNVVGQLPQCSCVTPSEAATWGFIKSHYR